MGRRKKRLAPGLEVVPKQTRATSTWLWVGLCAPSGEFGPAATDVVVAVGDRQAVTTSLTRYEYADAEGLDFFHGHLQVGSLEPATSYSVAVHPAGPAPSAHEVECRFTTLPETVSENPLRMVVASCFDIDNDTDRQLPALCQELFDDVSPDMTLLLGDQVYLDAPWHEFRSRTKHDPRKHYLTKYWSAWGRDADGHGGLSPLLSVGGNWFLPDDHEFWNNFPHATPLALHSIANWRHIIRARAGRTMAWLRGGQIPDALVTPPSTTEWDTWSRAAFELFGSFQTPAPGGEVSAGAADEQTEPPPRTPIVQHVDIGDVRVILLDTRTQRSRSAKAKRSAFVPPRELERFFDLAAGPELAIVALAQPAFQPPTPYRNFADKVRAFVDFDRGMENYKTMYPAFWKGLVAARDGKPTVFVGGDVHYNEVAVAQPLGIAQIVSSPMSLVTGLAELSEARERVFGRERRRREMRVDTLVPGVDGEIDWLVEHKSDDHQGLSTLDLTRQDGVYRLRVEHHRSDRASEGLRVDLIIDPSAPVDRQISATRLAQQPA